MMDPIFCWTPIRLKENSASTLSMILGFLSRKTWVVTSFSSLTNTWSGVMSEPWMEDDAGCVTNLDEPDSKRRKSHKVHLRERSMILAI